MFRRTSTLFVALLLLASVGCSNNPEGGEDTGAGMAGDVAEDTGSDGTETGTDSGQPDASPEDTGADEDTGETDTGQPDTAEGDTSGDDADAGGGDVDSGPADTGPDCSLDSDADGLDDCEEAQMCTDPEDGDTDGDGLSDFEELQKQTNPCNPDTDGDGATDKEELDVGLDPNAFSSGPGGTPDGERWRLTACEDPKAESVNYRENRAGNWKIALPPAFDSYYSELTLTNVSSPVASALYEDPTNEVFGYLLSKSATGSQNGPVDALRGDVRSKIGSVSNVIQDSTGGEFDTHGGKKAAIGRYLVQTSGKQSARKIREDLLVAMAPFAKADIQKGLPSTAGKQYDQFRVFVSVIFRANSSGADQSLISVALAPASSYDARDKVKFRMDDLSNTTNISERIDGHLTNCATFRPGQGTPKAEFYWVLDQSGSMNAENKIVSSFGQQFVNEVGNTSLDFRLGVTNMDKKNDGHLYTPPGWTKVPAEFANGIQNGVLNCQGTGGWNCSGSQEHGLEAAKRGLSYMLGLTPQQPTPKEAVRSNSQVITIIMTDEDSGTVKDNRGKSLGQVIAPYKQFFGGRTIVFSVTDAVGFSGGCRTKGQAYDEVALSTGGKVASLCSKDLTQTIRDIIFAATGLSSNYVLPQTPISSSLQVYLNGSWVPRSREDGFEYFAENNSIAFFGSFRPSPTEKGLGDFIAVSYEYFVDRCKETGNGAGNCSNSNP